MIRPVKRLLGVLGVGALASQAGHLLLYQLQFGTAAAAVQSQGAHAYFPALAKTSLGIGAVLLLAALLVIGAARFGTGRPIRTASSPPLMPLLSGLFTLQVTVFVVQETVEAMVAGSPAPHVVALVLLGTMGQAPVAVVAALAIKWLAGRFELAVASLRLQPLSSVLTTWAEVVLLPRLQPAAQTALAEASPASFVKRGPPQILLG